MPLFSGQPVISYLLTVGDSVSDRGTLAKRKLFGIIPLINSSGIKGNSPLNRFTNGLTWDDYVATFMINDFIVKELRKLYSKIANNVSKGYRFHKSLGLDDLSDAIITHDARMMKILDANSYTLDNDEQITLEGHNLARTYNEGGVTSHNYRFKLSSSLMRFFARLVVKPLEKKALELLQDDENPLITQAEKSSTLVIEWSGANDFITVNAKPSILEADLAVAARIKNARLLLEKGYKYIVLINMPDLSLMPRYQNTKTQIERDEATHCCEYFNNRLAEEVYKLNNEINNPGVAIEVCDIAAKFYDIYNHPEAYGLEKEKLKQPYKSSKDFVLNPDNKTSPSTGYMFWDDIHPTSDVHAMLAKIFYDEYYRAFNFERPPAISPQILVESFIATYAEMLNHQNKCTLPFFKKPELKLKPDDSPEENILKILRHYYEVKDPVTKKVLVNLGWVDKTGHIHARLFSMVKGAEKYLQQQATLRRDDLMLLQKLRKNGNLLDTQLRRPTLDMAFQNQRVSTLVRRH